MIGSGQPAPTLYAMPIIAYFAGDVQSYAALERWRPSLPEVCPSCRMPSRFISYGSYPRYVSEAESSWLKIRIPRFRCQSCGRTFGVLPNFLIPGRHYSASRIQSVLALRFQSGLSHRQLSQYYQGVPALSTCLAWIQAFTSRADLWLQAVLGALAHSNPGYDPLQDLVSPLGKAHVPPRLLLDLLPQMVVALGLTGQGLRAGLAQGLGLLTLWGQSRGLPCPI